MDMPTARPPKQGSPGPGVLTGVWPPLSATAPCAGSGHRGDAAPAPARLAQFSNPGSSQPLPQHSSREPDDPSAASEYLGQSEGPHAERRAEDP